jgi:hypothetical protein
VTERPPIDIPALQSLTKEELGRELLETLSAKDSVNGALALWMVSNGASLDVKNENDCTALILAVNRFETPVVKAVLDRKLAEGALSQEELDDARALAKELWHFDADPLLEAAAAALRKNPAPKSPAVKGPVN